MTRRGRSAPFVGVVLVGAGMASVLAELKSPHCTTLYIPFPEVARAFRSIDLEVDFDGLTEESCYVRATRRLLTLSDEEKHTLLQALTDVSSDATDVFMQALETALKRYVRRISICPLGGVLQTFNLAGEAIAGISVLEPGMGGGICSEHPRKFDVIVDYSNRDSIRASFGEKAHLIKFLRGL